MMTVLILTNPEHEHFVHSATAKTMDEHLVIIIISQGDATRFFDGWTYDIGISFMHQHKVPAEQVNSHPWFNFHPAPLPEYKGRDLCYHAIMNGEKEFGATVHYMDEGFDTGDIVAVERFGIEESWTAEDLSREAINRSKNLFINFLPKILETRVFFRRQSVGGTYYKKGQIIEEVPVRPDDPFGQFVRAVTYKDFHPRIDIGGVKYKIVREE
jgi:methionyl-tRNA formyltransferase